MNTSKAALLSGASLVVAMLIVASASSAQTGPSPTGPAGTTTNTDVTEAGTPASSAQTIPPAAASARGAEGSTAADGAEPNGDIVVTARRKALQSATDRKRNSDTIIDSVVADDAGKLPDNSITEVLQRVPGVSIVRFASLGDPDRYSVEGSGIQVRGLSGVLATLNGREIVGANGGGGISWGEVTPELMAAVDVYKASTADRIEGGIGGAVDLRTKMPFDFKKFTVSGTAQGGYGDASKKASYGGSFLVANTWDTGIGKLGFVLDLAYNKLRSQSSYVRAEPYYPRIVGGQDRYIPGGFDFGQEDFERQRRGFYGALQWEPTDGLRFFHTTFISNYRSKRGERVAFAVPNNTDVAQFPTPSADAMYDRNGILVSASALTAAGLPNFTSGSLTASATASRQENETRDYSQGFTWDVAPNLHVASALQFIESSSNSDTMSAALGAGFASFGFDTTGNLPSFIANPIGSFENRADYTWQSFAFNPDRNRAREAAANIDLSWDVGEGFLRQLQVGARYANRRERDNQIGTYWTGLGDRTSTLNDGPTTDSEFGNFKNFFKGDVALPATYFVPSQSLLGTFDPILIQTRYGYDMVANPNGPNPIGRQDRAGIIQTRLRNKAAYAQVRFADANGSLPFDGNIGLRVVRLERDGVGNSVVNNGNFYFSQADANADLADGVADNFVQQQVTTGINRESKNFTRFLPSFNINFKPMDNLAVRLAATRTMSLPDFYSTRATQNFGINTSLNANNTDTLSYNPIFNGFTADRGNAALKPTMSINLDASAEYYPSSDFNAHVAVFRKILTDQILYGTTLRPFSQTYTRPDGTSFTGNSIISSNEVYNAEKKSFVTGTEIGGRKFFTELPKPFDGLGVEANYTYIDSKSPSALARDINGNALSNIPIVGLSKHNANAQLLYERNPLSLRLAYSWRSRYLQTTNGNGTTPNYLLVDATGASRTVNASLPVYAAAYGQVDAGITVTVTKNVRLYVQGTNLTNSVTKTLMGGYPGDRLQTRSWFVSDRRVEGGINFTF